MAQMNPSTKQKQSHREQPRGCRGEGVGMGWESGVGKLLHLEWINNKVLLYSTRNYTQYPGTNHNRKEYFKKNVYMCKTESLCYTAEVGSTL